MNLRYSNVQVNSKLNFEVCEVIMKSKTKYDIFVHGIAFFFPVDIFFFFKEYV